MPYLQRHALPILLALSLPSPALAQSVTVNVDGGVSLNVAAIADGLEHPWGVDTLPNGELIV
ncbi:MAG: PQQ-dependent sugar dehydrogenase, partial [Pseudomonadota bacterium]